MEGALLAKNLLIELSHGGDELRAHAGLYVQLEVFGPLLFEFFLELCIAFSHDGCLHFDFGFLGDRNQNGGERQREKEMCFLYELVLLHIIKKAAIQRWTTAKGRKCLISRRLSSDRQK